MRAEAQRIVGGLIIGIFGCSGTGCSRGGTPTRPSALGTTGTEVRQNVTMNPEALRLVVEVTIDAAGATRWLRILGDDERGYLIVGDIEREAGRPLEDFWFPTLDEALTAAQRVGIPREAWGVDSSSPSAITHRARRRR